MTAAGAFAAAERELLARAVRRLRTERGMGLRAAGVLLGLNASNVSRLENGQRRPLPAERIAGAFGVTVAEVRAPCPQCRYRPSAGFQCLRCGTAAVAVHAEGTLPAVAFTLTGPGGELIATGELGGGEPGEPVAAIITALSGQARRRRASVRPAPQVAGPGGRT